MASSGTARGFSGGLIGGLCVALLSVLGTWWWATAVVDMRADRDPSRNLASLPGSDVDVVRRLPSAVAQLRRNPIDGDVFNLVYVAIARRDGVESPSARRAAEVLARYGWRSTPAQQNLIESAAYREDYRTVVDRADALLRRDKLRPQMAQILAAIERDPQQRPRIVARLLGHPNWRPDYLWRIAPGDDGALLDARVATLVALLDRGDRLTREEQSRSLQALIGAGHVADANRLWWRVTGRDANANLLYDPDFHVARQVGARPSFGIPYEWELRSGAGYSATLDMGRWPLRIEWAGATAGLPVFARQILAWPRPGQPLLLRVAADDLARVRENLTFTLSCGSEETAFVLQGSTGTDLTYLLNNDIPSCPAPAFSVVGRSGGGGSDALRIAGMRLTSIA